MFLAPLNKCTVICLNNVGHFHHTAHANKGLASPLHESQLTILVLFFQKMFFFCLIHFFFCQIVFTCGGVWTLNLSRYEASMLPTEPPILQKNITKVIRLSECYVWGDPGPLLGTRVCFPGLSTGGGKICQGGNPQSTRGLQLSFFLDPYSEYYCLPNSSIHYFYSDY